MSNVGTLLHRALAAADEAGDYWVHARHLSRGDVDQLEALTHQYAWKHGEDDTDRPGWRVLRSGVISWWQDEADVDHATRRRLRYLRTDVLKALADRDQGWKPFPRSTPWWVRAPR